MPLGINSNHNALFAARQMNAAGINQAKSLARLSSGLRINQAQDGPADLVISELLRSQLSGINQAARNAQEARNTLSIAEGGMNEMSSMLTKMRGLAVHALNGGVTSGAQTSADQAELNGMLNAMERIAGTTRYSDRQLLDGSQGIEFRADDPSGLIDAGATSITAVADDAGAVDMSFAGGATEQAEKAYVESATVAGGTLTEDVSFTVRGERGAQEFSFAAGTSMADVADAVDNASGNTGVSAYSIDGDTQLRLVSDRYGAEQEVEITQNEGTLFAAEGETVRDVGQNASVTVKGMTLETNGLVAEVANSAFTGRIVFDEGDPGATTIAQTGYDQDTLVDATDARSAELGDVRGGMQLQIGDGAGSQNRQVFGIDSVGLANIGNVEIDGEQYSAADLFSGGRASLATNPQAALEIIDRAVADVAGRRASIGAYQSNTLDSAINSLEIAAENVTATESDIRDTNVAETMTDFIRSQLLERVGAMNVQASNVNASNVLRLLGG